MAKTFRLKIRGDVNEYLTKVREAARERGVVLSGDATHGVFRKEASVPVLGKMVLLDGEYNSAGSSIVVTVRRIPPGYSWETIERMLKQFFEEG